MRVSTGDDDFVDLVQNELQVEPAFPRVADPPDAVVVALVLDASVVELFCRLLVRIVQQL